MKTRFFLALFMLGMAIGAKADQLQWNSRADAERAAKAIKPGSVMVSYCSECDNAKIEVWWAKSAVVTTTDDEKFYEVQVFGKRLMASQQTLDKGKFTGPVALSTKAVKPADRYFLKAVDLAYVYIPVGKSRFRVLGKELGLQADVQNEFVSLPADIVSKIETENEDKDASEK